MVRAPVMDVARLTAAKDNERPLARVRMTAIPATEQYRYRTTDQAGDEVGGDDARHPEF